jgi:hypothetical protein
MLYIWKVTDIARRGRRAESRYHEVPRDGKIAFLQIA